MRINQRSWLIASIASTLTFTSAVSASEREFTLDERQPTAVVDLAGNTDGIFLVRLTEPPVATYEGGIAGYEATSAKVNGSKKLNTKSDAAKKYGKRLKQRQRSVLESAEQKFGRSLTTKYDYQHAINGFAVALTANEAKALGNMAGVKAVQRERLEHLTTDVGPQWIKAPNLWYNGRRSSKGEGLVIAILDSGINSDHPSFASIGGDGYAVQNPLGSGNYLPGSYCDTVDANFCNDKLIGAWDMTDIDGTVPEDDDGHGSHTASTAAGNVVIGATLGAPTTTASFDISGVAPHANIIAYDVCQQTCPGSALIAAINQVIIDSGNLPNGIAALNYSISGGGDPYNDAVELGFLAAVEAGIYVAASAGNSGPDAGTVAHLGPWVSTTAASTHNRSIGNSLVNLSSDGAAISDFSGASFSAGYGPAPIVHASTTAFDPTGQCLTPFPPGTFNGEIVMCDRGTIARTEKGENVLAGGAGGYILGNLGQGEGTSADAHFLPAIHLGDTSAAALRSWLSSNTGTIGTITESSFNYDRANGDIMAGFSSRGPQSAFDVLKPDVTAPGVDIMGAEANGQTALAPEYQIISGTSMSSPHNAGAGALMSAAHPDWTPTEIKSAMMLTAKNMNTFKEDGVTPTDPFDLGAGRINLKSADHSTLVLSETIDNFNAADPALGGDPSTLNIASMMNSNCVGTCSWTRTVTNKSRRTGIWYVSASGDGFDVDVDIDGPSNGWNGHWGYGHGNWHKLKKWYKRGHHGARKNRPQRLRLRKGQSASITVTATNYSSEEGWQFGTLNLSTKNRSYYGWKHWGYHGNRRPDLSMPIAVFASKASKPELFTKSVDSATANDGDTLSYQLNVTNGPLTGPITVTDAVPAGASIVVGSETESVTGGITTAAWAHDGGSNTLSWTGELAPGGLDVQALGGITGYFALSNVTAPFALPANCDDGAVILNVPSFTYNGQSYSDVIWSVNGTLEAGTGSGLASSFANQNFPDSEAPNNLLAPYWRDLDACSGGSWSVAVLNSGPFQWTVFEWTDVPHFGSADAASFQVWLLNDGSPVGVLPQAHFAYGRVDNPNVGLTVGAENIDGTDGSTYFFNGVGNPPAIGTDLHVNTLQGGSATLGFDVITDCSEELIINRANLANDGGDETAIAVTSCE